MILKVSRVPEGYSVFLVSFCLTGILGMVGLNSIQYCLQLDFTIIKMVFWSIHFRDCEVPLKKNYRLKPMLSNFCINLNSQDSHFFKYISNNTQNDHQVSHFVQSLLGLICLIVLFIGAYSTFDGKANQHFSRLSYHLMAKSNIEFDLPIRILKWLKWNWKLLKKCWIIFTSKRAWQSQRPLAGS